MKKFLATILAMIMMVGLVPVMASAQSYTYQRVYSNGRYRYVRVYKKRSFYKRHRKVINTAIGTGAGAGLGAIIGGKKGALVGGLLGAGGATVYNLKTRKKRRY